MAVPQHRTGARKRPCFVWGLALAAAVALAGAGSVQARPAAGRIMPPAQARQCQGDLTSYFGKVIGYKRGKASTWLKIATDYDTIEAVTIPHKGAKDAERQNYLYRGRAFTAKDWARIESKPGVLRPGTRATAWVCDGRVTLVDWNGAAE
jgi:hypothetical protein